MILDKKALSMSISVENKPMLGQFSASTPKSTKR
jgi:hypothetical protein